jgi:hypothetical protein
MIGVPKLILPATHSGATQQRTVQTTDPGIFRRCCIVNPHNLPALLSFLDQRKRASFVYHLRTGVIAAGGVETGHSELALAAFSVTSVTDELKNLVIGGILKGEYLPPSRFRLSVQLGSGTFNVLRDTNPMEGSLLRLLGTGGYKIFCRVSHPENKLDRFFIDILDPDAM